MALRLITPPADTPVSLTEAKAHLRVDHADDDVLIGSLIDAVTDHVQGKDGFLGRALIDQTWELVLDTFPDGKIEIPLPPLIEVISVKYDDASSVEQTIDAADYIVDASSEPARIGLLTGGIWPTPYDGIGSVRIRYRAGYLDSSSPPVANVPADIKAAMLLMIGTLYAQRETIVVGQSVVEVPWAADVLLRRKRIEKSMA